MAEINQPQPENWLEEPKKLPSMLNVLTILTFIGCGLAFIGGVVGFFTAQTNYNNQLKLQDQMDNMPDIVKHMMGPNPVETAHRQLENRLPIMLLTVVGAALCLYGAIQMRKLKKSGYPIYIVGEILPFVTLIIFIGMGMFSGFTMAFSILFAVAFIIMYGTQLKYMS